MENQIQIDHVTYTVSRAYDGNKTVKDVMGDYLFYKRCSKEHLTKKTVSPYNACDVDTAMFREVT